MFPRAFFTPDIGGAEPNIAGTTEILRYQPNEIQLRVQSNRAGYLVITDTWYPGWIAREGQEQRDVIKAYGTFRAVELGAGVHTLTLAFIPLSFRLGIYLSTLTFTLGLALWLVRLTGGRKKS
jgi:uncharacterized membrane protein YfhO